MSRISRRNTVRRSYAFPTWNPSDNSGMTLSNSNRTAAGSAGVYSMVRGTKPLTSGRWYFEVQTTGTWSAANNCVGITSRTSSAANGSAIGGNGASSAVLYRDGRCYTGPAGGGGPQTDQLGTLPSGCRIDVAVNIDAKKIWFRVNGGNWNGNASYSPTTGVGGYDITSALATGTMYPVWVTQSVTDSVTANFGSTAFAGSVPAGYSATGGSPTSFYVDNAASGANNGTSWANAWTSFGAINWGAVAAGDTIYVSGGTTSKTYAEAVTVGASGAAGKPLTIKRGVDAGHTGEPIIDCASTRAIGLTINARNYVIVDGLAARDPTDCCYFVTGCTAGVEVKNCRAQAGVNLTANSRGFDIRSNISSGGVGTYAVTIRQNTITTPSNSNTQNDGMFTYRNNGVLVVGNTITISNIDTTQHCDGIQSIEDVALTIRENRIDTVAENNHGIWITDVNASGTVDVFNNIVTTHGEEMCIGHWNQNYGSGLTGKVRIYNNTLYGGYYAVMLWDAPNSEVKNNICWPAAGHIGIQLTVTSAAQPAAANIDYNLVWAPSATVANIGGTAKTWAQWQAAGYDAHGVNADPLFANAGAGDFHLQSGSPAKDAGLTLAAVTYDMGGTTRPVGAGYSIGAYEA